ncbi:MAG: bacteriophage Gp15 family protein [Defluviitaleaceae bacterium]|nr:bacteriophage Gp15 family protein [Defluviitaleaceae bacterium]
MIFDKALIEASFAMQYGIRLAREDIAFGEYCRLLSGLMADTPLGRVVAIRAEKDGAKIKGFGEYEREVRRRWREFERRTTPSAPRAGAATPPPEGNWARDIGKLQDSLEEAFGAR